MDKNSRSYTFDWCEDSRGYTWVVAEQCPVDGLLLRTGHSPGFFSLVNSLLSITWESAVGDNYFCSLSKYPVKYPAASLNGYSKVMSSSRGELLSYSFILSPNHGESTGIAYAISAFLEHSFLEPLGLREISDALPEREHPEFWTPAIKKALRSIPGNRGKIRSISSISSVRAPQESKPLKRWEKWMAESIPRGAIVYATDGSAGKDSGISYSYVTSTGKYYVGDERKAEGNSYHAELKAFLAARRDALKHAAKGRRVVILSDSTSVIGVAKKMTLPRGVREGMIEIRWVKAHSGHPLNQAADTIASLARKRDLSAEEKRARMDYVMNQQIIQWQRHVDSMEKASSTLGEQWSSSLAERW